jgi:hypothetical protein
LDKKDINDVEYTIKSLNLELVRNFYWKVPIDSVATSRAHKKGLAGLKEWVPKRIVDSVGSPSSQLWRDGMQTPPDENVVFYAQHATGCCCRKCMEEWHGKPREKRLEREDVAYFTDLIMTYIQRRMPSLPTYGSTAGSPFRVVTG